MKPRRIRGKYVAGELIPGEPMKSQIIRELGQTDILLPALVTDVLAANDRIKVRMSPTAGGRAARAAAEPACGGFRG